MYLRKVVLKFLVLFGWVVIAYSAGAATVEPVIRFKVDNAFLPAIYDSATYTGYLGKRMGLNVTHRLLQLDVDTLLGPFQQRSGGQWWLGEHIGKYIHASTFAWRFTRDERLKQQLDYAVQKLIATQLPSGYLGTYPEKNRFIEGDGISWDGPVWDVWAHKYCMIGLLTYYRATGYQPALDASRKAADLLCNTFGPGKKSLVRASSHVGMASTSVLEPMAVLYAFTADEKYLEFCRYIVKSWEEPPAPRILSSLLEHGNVYKTANNKAYEMLSNLVGLMELYRIEGDKRYLRACEAAWEDIRTRRLYPVGTTSYAEHFTDDFVLPIEKRQADDEAKIGEGCVTVTWLQLNTHLLHATGESRYASAIERTIYNALPAAQSPHSGKVCYFLPINGHRRFGEVSHGLRPDISCCSSSIPRGLALIPEVVAGALRGSPAILQYEQGAHTIAARAGGKPISIRLELQTQYPAEGAVRINVQPSRPAKFPLLLRVPDWSESFIATVNGSGKQYTGKAGQMLEIDRKWSSGDQVEILMEMAILRHKDPNAGSARYWYSRGPQVLARDELVTGGELPQDWWGNQVYSVPDEATGSRTFMVPFAEAGQQKQPYLVILGGSKKPE